MKTRPLLFCCLLLFASCSQPNREAQKLLHQAESIVETYPDSALRLIDSVMHMEFYFSEAKRMEMSLLQGRAIYGDDRDATDPTEPNGNLMLDKIMNQIYLSPDLDRAPAYFAKHDHPEKAALAALYKGYDLQEIFADSIALPSFRESARYGLLADDSLTTARALYQTGRLLYQNEQYEEASTVLDSADLYFGKRLYEKAYVQNMLCLNYCFLNEYDKATECYAQCLDFATESSNDDAVWRAWFNYGMMLGNKTLDQRDEGIKVLKQLNVEGDGLKLATQADAIRKLFRDHNLLHKIEPIYDDSCNYYLDIWNKSKKTNEKYQVSGIKMYNSYGRQHDLFPLSPMRWETDRKCSEHYSLKQYNRQRQRTKYLAIRNAMDATQIQEQHKVLVFCMIALAVLFLIIGILLFLRKRKPIAEELVAKLETEISNAEKEKHAFDSNSFVNQEITSRLRLILTAQRAEKRANDPKKEWNPLVRQVMNGKETAFEAAVSVIESAYPGLQAKIGELYPNLNDTDSKVCLLSCSDITNTEMGELLGLSVYSVNKSRSELRKKLGFEPGDLKKQL